MTLDYILNHTLPYINIRKCHMLCNHWVRTSSNGECLNTDKGIDTLIAKIPYKP